MTTANGNGTAPINRFVQQHRERQRDDALVARLVAELNPGRTSSPWLSTRDAASYLRCPESRLRKLVMVRAIPFHKEGRRVLFSRDELDEFVRSGGAIAP